MKEFKFEIGNSAHGDIGAVFYLTAKNKRQAVSKFRKWLKVTEGMQLTDRAEKESGVKCLVYFGVPKTIMSSVHIEEQKRD